MDNVKVTKNTFDPKTGKVTTAELHGKELKEYLLSIGFIVKEKPEKQEDEDG